MKATEILSEEHQVILRVIAALETGSAKLSRGQNVRPGFFLDAAEFVKGFADGCHHRKEENVLFKTLNEYGLPANSGPVAVMLNEHEQGRQFIRRLTAAAKAIEQGDLAAKPEAIAAAQGYAALLRQHIAKEDGVLFPMADQVIPLERQDVVWEAFEHVEHEETGAGVHEKYLALAEKIEAEAAG